MPSFAHSVYFWFSLTFLITRTLAVSLYAANINDESKKPARVFRAVPRESWCLEVCMRFRVDARPGHKFMPMHAPGVGAVWLVRR